MGSIQEIGFDRLNDLVEFINNNWDEISQISLAKNEDKELSYWLKNYKSYRILKYMNEGIIIGILVLTKENKTTLVTHCYVTSEAREKGIGSKLLRMAEKFAINWKSERILLKIADKEEVERYFPFLQKQGYTLHCSMSEPNSLTLEKLMREH